MKQGTKVRAVSSSIVPKGTIGTVIAYQPETCPADPNFAYASAECGMLVQSNGTDINIHGTPNTSWEFINNWEIIESEYKGFFSQFVALIRRLF